MNIINFQKKNESFDRLIYFKKRKYGRKDPKKKKLDGCGLCARYHPSKCINRHFRGCFITPFIADFLSNGFADFMS